MPARVLYLHHVVELSGAERSLRLLLRHLDRARVEPLFAGPSRGPLVAALAADGVPTLPLPFSRLREVGAVLLTTILMLLSEGFHRQSFIDLAVIFAPMSLVGSLLFARLMERNL